MKRPFNRILSAVLVVVLCISLLSGLSFAATVNYKTGNPEGFQNVILNWGQRGTTATFLSPNAIAFYEDNDVTYSQLNALAGAPGAGRIDGMPRGSSTGDPVANRVEQLVTLQERYAAEVERLAGVQTAIEEMIEGLEPIERTVLRHRYIEGLSWEAVCVVMSYSWRSVHNYHSSALDKLVEKTTTGGMAI